MAVVVGLGALATALLFVADFIEDAFGTPLSSPRTPVLFLPLLLIGCWTAVPAVLAAVAYRTLRVHLTRSGGACRTSGRTCNAG
jgi:hypothetical protein